MILNFFLKKVTQFLKMLNLHAEQKKNPKKTKPDCQHHETYMFEVQYTCRAAACKYQWLNVSGVADGRKLILHH